MITVKLKHLRISPRKVRLATGLIKGLGVKEAENQLKFLAKRSAAPVLKLLNSAIANALKDQNLSKENLYVSAVKVDGGPSLKRWRARAMGRAASILKRTSHITLTLKERDLSAMAAGETTEKKTPKPEKEAAVAVETEKKEARRPLSGVVERAETKTKSLPREKKFAPKKPYQKDSRAKKRFFSRQTFGNAKKVFRRKSI